MKLDRFACSDCTLTYWVPGDSGYLILMCPRCGHENPMVRADSFDVPYLVHLPVSVAKTGRGAKRSTSSRPTLSPPRKRPTPSPPAVTMALKLGGGE